MKKLTTPLFLISLWLLIFNTATAFAFTTPQERQIRRWFVVDGLTCDVVTDQVESMWGYQCPTLPAALSPMTCFGALESNCIIDADGDGFYSGASSIDCNDSDSTIHPKAPEIVVDGQDNDCDGLVDETTSVTYGLDDFETDNDASSDYWCTGMVHDFFGCKAVFYDGGVGNNVSLSLDNSESIPGSLRSLNIDYTVNAGTGLVGAIWEMANLDFAVDDATVQMEELCLWLKDPDAAAPYQVTVEFVDALSAVDTSSTITVTNTWGQQCIDLDPLKSGIDFSRLTKIALLLADTEVPTTDGNLFVDDIAFIDNNFADFTTFDRLGDYKIFLDLNIARGVRFFLDHTDTDTGLTRDKTSRLDVYSIASAGFGLAVISLGVDRGLVDPGMAETLIANALTTLLDNTDAAAIHNGFYSHFLGIDDSVFPPQAFRYGDSEISSIDTSLLLAGILVARQAFPKHPTIPGDAQTIYDNVQWSSFLNTTDAGFDGQRLHQFYLGWKPEYVANDYEIIDPTGGYFTGLLDYGDINPAYAGIVHPTTWDYYTDEQTLIAILAAQSSTFAADACVLWEVTRTTSSLNPDLVAQTFNGSGYAHVFADIFIDFASLGTETAGLDCDGNPALNINHFTNDQACYTEMAAQSLAESLTYPALAVLPYGHSASIGMGAASTWTDYGVYEDWGSTACAYDAFLPDQNGNVSAPAQAMAMLFGDPDLTRNKPFRQLAQAYNNYPRLWGVYGFRDAMNLGTPTLGSGEWFGHDYFGINIGPAIIAMDLMDPTTPGQTRDRFEAAIDIGTLVW